MQETNQLLIFRLYFFIAAQIARVAPVNAFQMDLATWATWAAIKQYSLNMHVSARVILSQSCFTRITPQI